MKWKLDYSIFILYIQFFLDSLEFQVNQESIHLSLTILKVVLALKAIEELQGDSLRLISESPGVPGTHLIDLRRMKDWDDPGTTLILNLWPLNEESCDLTTTPLLHSFSLWGYKLWLVFCCNLITHKFDDVLHLIIKVFRSNNKYYYMLSLRVFKWLTHYSPVLPFFTTWKHKKTFRFSGGIEKQQRAVMG